MRQERLISLSPREKLKNATNAFLAFSVVINMNLPPQYNDFLCEQAIVESYVELQKAPLLGFTFNPNEARFVGLDPKFAMEEILKIGFDQVRIAMYPNQPTEQMVDEVRWQVDLAEKNNTDVILVVGRKAPGWPEEYLPRSAREETLEKTRAVLEVVGRHNSVKIIQVSNEPYLQVPGLDREEQELLDAMLDSILPYGKPTLFTHLADPMRLRAHAFGEVLTIGDIGGINVYIETSAGRGSCSKYTSRLRYLNNMAEKDEKPLIVTELQTLPWPDQLRVPLPDDNVLYIPLPLQHNLHPEEIRKLYKMVLMNTDAESIFFWELVKALALAQNGEPETWNEVQRIIDRNHQTRIRLREQQHEEQGTTISFSDDHSMLPLVP